MTVRRVMGIETEYGITFPPHLGLNATQACSHVVNAYATASLGRTRQRPRWDYDTEAPLRDARGFDMSRAEADPSQLTDEDFGMANAVLTNGARLYVDHAHPEYSSPEVLTPRQGVIWDRAGEQIMAAGAASASASLSEGEIVVYKNNVDNKGASYGTHENYLTERAISFPDIVRHLMAFFVSRQVIVGAGRIGLGQESTTAGFQISQRADYCEVEVGLETTLKRPIINTRDEPHADPTRYRRLHVIVGDANLAETATLLKLGTTSLALWLLENGGLDEDLMIASPVSEIHAVSHDPRLGHLVRMADGRRLTALDIQERYLTEIRDRLEERGGIPDADTAEIVNLWQECIDALRDDPLRMHGVLDWPTKWAILEGYRSRDGLDWDHARLAAVDLQYSDMRNDKGLALRLMASGRLRTVVDPAAVAAAVTTPPEDTRAWFRGECIRRFPESVAAASWDSVIFDLPGQSALQRLTTLEPLRGTRAHVGSVLDASPTAAELVAAITSLGPAADTPHAR